jgi:hypothetical protein
VRSAGLLLSKTCEGGFIMTDEQKTRIRQAGPNDCEFDGMPMHPHYRHFLICAGFKDDTVCMVTTFFTNAKIRLFFDMEKLFFEGGFVEKSDN